MSKTKTTLVDQGGNAQRISSAQESVRKFWLFGLGAYSLATRTGAQAFETLLEEGKALRPKARRQIKESSAELVSTATESIDRGEQLLRDRLLRPLHSMLLASKGDVEQLAEGLTQLATEVRKLTGSGDAPTAKKAAASTKPGSKAAATTVALPAAESTVADDAPMMLSAP
jgi:poly(hydroxyalkanoate) granule-associated protein